ncbi:uncharacterized protein [Cicer arietinum]|uniref:uncharacterized protein n=1 Tax=Cicer arietinum TaxID=3827 RepID=UPI003CC692B2
MHTTFVLDEGRKSYILRVGGKIHRGFRSHLSNFYLKDREGNTSVEPPKIYQHYISKDEWRAFVSKRSDPAFVNISKANRERASNPKHPYKKSRMGYARLDQQLRKDTQADQPLGRHILWKEARVNKDRVVDNENVKKVVELCEIIEQSSENPEGNKDTCRDILGKVFNVPEYSGRVRGKGFGVTPKSFFPQEKRQKPSNEEVLEKLRILSEQVALLVNTNKDKQLPVQLQPEIQMESETGSCNVGLKSIPEGVTTCVLYLSSPTQRKVGKGILHNTSGEVLHNIPIPAGHVKVSPTVAFEPTAPLPIPDNDGDMKFLSDAIGSYVAWPTNLVALQKKIPKDKSVTSPEKVQINKPPLQPKKGSKPQKLEVNRAAKLQRLEGNKAAKLAATKNLDRGKSVAAAAAPNKSQPRLGKYGACLDIQIKRNMGSSNDSPIVQMNKDIFGDEYIEYLEKEHMYELLEHKELSVTVISLYIRFLYEKVVCTRKLSNKYSFLSPHKMSMFKLDPDNVKHYIVDMFLRNKESDKLFLAPYNSGYGLRTHDPERDPAQIARDLFFPRDALRRRGHVLHRAAPARSRREPALLTT